MTNWPLQSDKAAMVAKFGNPDSNGDGAADLSWTAKHLTTIVPPYQLYYAGKPVKKITLNSEIAEPVTRALTKIGNTFPDAKERAKLGIDQFDGCFNFRVKRGKSKSLSMHAYAVALDFSAARNPFHAKRSDLPAEFIKAFTDEGATWLGPTLDPMHFQFARTK
jgi:hypothetical protein